MDQQNPQENSSTSMSTQTVGQRPNSPRKKKAPPLDLDAALYIQSQAEYVQEPNQPNHQQRVSAGAPIGCANSSISSSISGNNGLPPIARINNNQQQQQQITLKNNNNYFQNQTTLTSTSASSTDRIYPQNCHHFNNNYNNISVDYIDCVSNDDLSGTPLGTNAHSANKTQLHSTTTTTTTTTATTATTHQQMCSRKHLRFLRNRVEPTEVAAAATAEVVPNAETINRIHSADTGAATGDSSSSIGIGESSGGGGATSAINSSSVLYPISVGEVKKRTYFIGSLGQDSLLGYEELNRYFPNNRVSIFVCTWNQNRKRAPINLSDLLLPDQLVYMADIYAIGIQEAFSSQGDYLREWEIELQTTLGPNYVLLHSCSLGVLHLALFVRRDLIWFCSVPEESVYNSRSMPTNMIKTKGAVSIAFRFFGTSFMFTNCHFPAHENKLKDRIDEYQRIISSIDLPKNLKLLKPRYLSNDSTARFDCVFFMGDLNFRLEQRTFDETISILEDIFQQKEPSYESLISNDELMKVMESGQAFHGFDESQIKFPPTYKFLAQTNKYDKQTKRVPSYTDRILFRSKRQRHIQCLTYDWLPQMISSDHKPVFSLFDVLIRPGHEQNMLSTLNAGLFQRTIYLEALKRRAEDPEVLGGENGTGGSLICSIS